MEWTYLLEVGNGLWAIVSAYLVVFLAYHLIVVAGQRKVAWREWPLSMQLAAGVWIAVFGVLTTRSVVWSSRYANDSYLLLTPLGSVVFGLGVFAGLVGFLCILRVATKPMLGHWPWISCLICCSFYLLWASVHIPT